MIYSYRPWLGFNPSYVATPPKPPGATTQWISFWFRSNGYFANTSSHIAVGTRGTFGAPDPFFFRGRGIIIGKSYLSQLHGVTPEGNTLGGCLVGTGPWSSTSQPPGTVQVETWNNVLSPENGVFNGTRVYSNSCSAPVLQDYQWYNVSIGANDAGWLAYEILDVNLQSLAQFSGFFPLTSSVGALANGGLEPEGGQIFIVHDGLGVVNGLNDFGRDWTVEFLYINHGWY